MKTPKMPRDKKLALDGWYCSYCEYDGDAQQWAKKFEEKGIEVKLVRCKTDTPYLKCFNIWVKGPKAILDEAGIWYSTDANKFYGVPEL